MVVWVTKKQAVDYLYLAGNEDYTRSKCKGLARDEHTRMMEPEDCQLRIIRTRGSHL